MPRSESLASIGAARSRMLRQHLAAELADLRRSSGLSQREIGRRVGCSGQTIARLERGDPATLTVDLVARTASVLGLQLAASLHPAADPVRDRAHLALIRRFRARLSPALRWREEVPIPITGDRRSGDGLIEGDGWEALVEAETRLGDLQMIERRAAAKQRDLGTDRLILAVADTRHNRKVVALYPELRGRFPIDARACLRRLAVGDDPGGDALVLV